MLSFLDFTSLYNLKLDEPFFSSFLDGLTIIADQSLSNFSLGRICFEGVFLLELAIFLFSFLLFLLSKYQKIQLLDLRLNPGQVFFLYFSSYPYSLFGTFRLG